MGDPVKRAKRILGSKTYKRRLAKGKSTPRADKATKAAVESMTPIMRKGGATKKFKVHKMYKGTKVEIAKTMADHNRLKKKGYGHTKPKAKKKK